MHMHPAQSADTHIIIWFRKPFSLHHWDESIPQIFYLY